MGTDILKKAAMLAVVLFSFCTGAKGYMFYGVNYILRSDNTAAVTKLNEGLYEGDITIWGRFTVDEVPYRVTEIGYYAFKNCTGLTSITLPSTLEVIDNEAFWGCTALTTISIPESLTTIKDYAFKDCTALTTISYSYGLFSIGNLKEIATYAFSGCTSLTSVWIPNSVTTIGNGAFRGCTSLERVYISSLDKWCAIDFGSAIQGHPVLGNAHYLYVDNTLVTDLVVPAVETIKKNTFASIYLNSIEVQEGTTDIGDRAFSEIKADYVILPSTLQNIAERAFAKMTGVTDVYCQAMTPPTIVSKTFQNVDLSAVTLHVPQAAISAYRNHEFWGAFGNFKATIPLGLREQGGLKYRLTPQKTATVEGVNSSELPQDLNIPANINVEGYTYQVKKIKEKAFQYTDLNSVTLPNSIVEIGQRAFQHSKLKTINLPANITDIGEYAFYYCENLEAVTIPPKIKILEDGTFKYCQKLTSATIPNGVEAIGQQAFSDCAALKTLSLGNSLKKIGVNAFRECILLDNVVIPNSVVTIEGGAFYNCKGMKALTLGNGIQTIGRNAFYYCNSLTALSLGRNVETIGNEAFANCSQLKEVTIPDKVTTIGSSAFNRCTGLETVNIGNGLKTVDLHVFDYCTNITTISLGKAMEKIESGNFSLCPNLQTVYCYAETPPNVKYLDDGSIFYQTNIFNAENAANATLYVPSASMPLYLQSTVWNIFGTVAPIRYPTAVDGVENTADDGQWYDLTGRKVERPTKGVYIKDGKKIMVK